MAKTSIVTERAQAFSCKRKLQV